MKQEVVSSHSRHSPVKVKPCHDVNDSPTLECIHVRVPDTREEDFVHLQCRANRNEKGLIHQAEKNWHTRKALPCCFISWIMKKK